VFSIHHLAVVYGVFYILLDRIAWSFTYRSQPARWRLSIIEISNIYYVTKKRCKQSRDYSKNYYDLFVIHTQRTTQLKSAHKYKHMKQHKRSEGKADCVEMECIEKKNKARDKNEQRVDLTRASHCQPVHRMSIMAVITVVLKLSLDNVNEPSRHCTSSLKVGRW
jgi:hypothetical protein